MGPVTSLISIAQTYLTQPCPGTLSSLLFLEHSRHALAFPSGSSSPASHVVLFPLSFKSGPRATLTVRLSLTTLSQCTPSTPSTPFPLLGFAFFYRTGRPLVFYRIYLLIFFIILSRYTMKAFSGQQVLSILITDVAQCLNEYLDPAGTQKQFFFLLLHLWCSFQNPITRV